MIVEHNNCQIVAMGARVVGDELAKAICLDAFFGATFPGGRHTEEQGVQIIKDMEVSQYKPKRCNCWKDAPIHLEFLGDFMVFSLSL